MQFSHLNTLTIKHGVAVEENVVLTHVAENAVTDVLTMMTKNGNITTALYSRRII